MTPADWLDYERDRMLKEAPMWTDEGLHNVTDPTPDDRTMPPGSSVAYVIIFWAAAVFLTLGYVAVDRVWHATVTQHNEQRVR